MKAALSSVLKHHKKVLYPIILISGNSTHMPHWLRSLNNSRNALVLMHQLSFSTRIKKFNEGLSQDPKFLRIDIPVVINDVRQHISPQISAQYDFALYTDTDVIFTEHFRLESLGKPAVIMIGPEMAAKSKANSGILYMNLRAMGEHYTPLLDFADSKKWEFDAVDQGLILSYFNSHGSELLPDDYNWKPYWGVSKTASIIHFHGAKPGVGAECFAVNSENYRMCNIPAYEAVSTYIYNMYNISFQTQSASYAHYLALYYHYQSIFEVKVNQFKFRHEG